MHQQGHRGSVKRIDVSAFAEFLERTADDDRQFIGIDDLHKIPASVCALANSSGGWIVAGAERDINDDITITGLNDDPEKYIPAEIPHEVHEFDEATAIYVPTLEWYRKPIVLNGQVYRRVEGENVISGKWARSVMSADALEFSRDDCPVKNITLNDNDINEFTTKFSAVSRDVRGNFIFGKQARSVMSPNVNNDDTNEFTVKTRDEGGRVIFGKHARSDTHYPVNDDFTKKARDDFMRKCGVYSGKHITLAGALMFGELVNVRAVLSYSSGHAELERHNLWRAYSDILPRLTARLSGKCAAALREVFVNALLHADYNIDRHIDIAITSSPPKITITNPGTIRGTTRNYRLAKLFRLSGMSGGGMKPIYDYAPNFKLEQDMLNFRVSATLTLEGLPAPVLL